MKYFLLFLILASLIIIPSSVHSCSCAAPFTPEEGLNQSDTVFEGKVKEIQKNRKSGLEYKLVTFEITQYWKGDLLSREIVRTPGDSGGCGYEFREGTTYLVYATKDTGGTLNASLCSRTAPIEEASEDLKAFGNGILPQTESETESDSLPLVTLIFLIIAAGVFVLLERNRTKGH